MSASEKAKAYGSSIELERFLEDGGTLAQWYACAASEPIETAETISRRKRERIMAQMPSGLTAEEMRAWVRAAMGAT